MGGVKGKEGKGGSSAFYFPLFKNSRIKRREFGVPVFQMLFLLYGVSCVRY